MNNEEKTDSTFRDNDSLNRYKKELSEDITLTVSNIREKSLQSSALRCKWLNYYFVEKENLARIKKAKEEYLKKKLPTASNSLLSLKNKDKLSENDEIMIKLNKLTEKTKENIDYLSQVQNIMNDFGFNIKNSIEIFKLERM